MELEALAILAFGLLAIPEDDKKLHFAAGAGTAAITQEMGWSPLETCFASLSLGIAKELVDSQTGGNVEFKDGLATAVGCSVTFRF